MPIALGDGRGRLAARRRHRRLANVALRADSGSAASPIHRWPATSQLVRDPGRPTLIMFVHPHCPCSRATLAELDRLLSPRRDRVAVRIVMVRPSGFEAGCGTVRPWPAARADRRSEVLTTRMASKRDDFGANFRRDHVVHSRRPARLRRRDHRLARTRGGQCRPRRP